MVKKNYDINFLIMNLLLVIYGIEVVFPPITVIINSTLVCAMCLFGWIIFSFITDKDYYLRQNLRNTYPLIFYFATVFVPYLFGIGVIGNRYLSLGLIPLGYFIFNYYKQKERLRDLKRISYVIAFFAIITFFITLKALIENPYISRSIKSSGEYSATLAQQGIGGYSFIYFIVVVSVFLLYISLKSKTKFLRIITIIGYVISLFFVLKSNYMTALLTVILASAVLIVSNRKKGALNNIALFLFIIIAFLIIININVIIDKYADFIPSRIARVVVSGSGESIYKLIFEEFINDRWPTMLKSIEVFFRHPFLGIVGSGAVGLDGSNGLFEFGQHSHILDTFAIYGVAIGIVNIFILFKPFTDQNGKRIKYGKALNNAMIVCIIGIYLFNNATPSIALALGIFFPLLREILDSGCKI